MSSAHPDRKQKIKHELREMLELFVYLAFFFVANAIYDMLLLKQYNVEYLTITFALINAAVITKVIMIGEYAKLGRRHENKALLISAVWKALVFGLLVFAFHVVEELIKRLIHGEDMARASLEMRFAPWEKMNSGHWYTGRSQAGTNCRPGKRVEWAVEHSACVIATQSR